MQLLRSLIPFGFAFASLVATSPIASHDKRLFVERDGTNFTVFEHAATGAKLEFVKNSGILWFWFFEARSNATTAPLAAWFNGGPGCSSMIGLFQENGPCHFVNGASTPSLNQYSWNSYANMLYIDQPVGVGFSYGTDSVTSTVTAAPYVWKLIQAFYAQFPQYKNRDFGIFTESYGGHYGPEFAEYFEQQNAAVASGSVGGQNIKLVALGVNNGWFDAILQEKAYIDYSYSNSYRPLISASQRTSYLNTYQTKCLPALQACASSGSDSACTNADKVCYNNIEGPLSQSGDFDVYDIRSPSNDPNPPQTYVSYLQSSAVVQAIGAKTTYQECPNAPYQKFSATGDNPRSFLAQLSDVVQKGVQTVVWAGDADWICNWFGNQAAAEAVSYDGHAAFQSAALMPFNVAGKQAGTFKAVGKLSFARVFGAGHEVPFYQPAAALQVFRQTMMQRPLSST
ncbi:MAG: hypothetical protein LQ343_000232 [Gyalolechia ehrenbergii]|nr:MAG: hypothetical protein LQ343_000232 [Gyalolechia ehrenbergii]